MRYGYSLPKHMKPSNGYDILYNDDIYVFPKPKQQLFPLFYFELEKI